MSPTFKSLFITLNLSMSCSRREGRGDVRDGGEGKRGKMKEKEEGEKQKIKQKTIL